MHKTCILFTKIVITFERSKKEFPDTVFLPDYQATFSPKFREKHRKLAGKKLKMCTSLAEIFVLKYEGKCYLSQKRSLMVSIWTAEHTASEWIRNRSTDCSKRIHWTAEENFWTDEVERLNGWRKFLNGWSRTAEQMRKIFERQKSNDWRKFLNGRSRMAELLKFVFERLVVKGWTAE